MPGTPLSTPLTRQLDRQIDWLYRRRWTFEDRPLADVVTAITGGHDDGLFIRLVRSNDEPSINVALWTLLPELRREILVRRRSLRTHAERTAALDDLIAHVAIVLGEPSVGGHQLTISAAVDRARHRARRQDHAYRPDRPDSPQRKRVEVTTDPQLLGLSGDIARTDPDPTSRAALARLDLRATAVAAHRAIAEHRITAPAWISLVQACVDDGLPADPSLNPSTARSRTHHTRRVVRDLLVA